MGEARTDATVPVHVLTGFLGSGKTTLLNRLLSRQALADSAVIVNEFGEISLDHLLVEHSEDNLIELAGGCVCCAVRGDLARTMMELLEKRAAGNRPPFERIIVETTGLADPTPIGNLLVTDPDLVERVHLGSILTTVDAINGPGTLDHHPDAIRQVALADTLVVTKSDLNNEQNIGTGSEAGMLEAMEERLAKLNPRARIHHAVLGDLPDTLALFEVSDTSQSFDATHRHGHGHAPAHEHAHAHTHNHTEGIDSFVLHRSEPLPGAAIGLFIETLTEHAGANLLRLKGLVCIEEAPEQPVLIQGAQHVFHPFEMLDEWPSADTDTRLVFITQGIAPAWAERLLDALVWESRDIVKRLAK